MWLPGEPSVIVPASLLFAESEVENWENIVFFCDMENFFMSVRPRGVIR